MPEFTIVNGEGVGENLACYGVYEEDLTEAFIRLVRRGDMVLDIGMHLGYYTTLFAQLVGIEGAVHAFEPTPSTREIAAKNVGPFPNVTVHPCAVWSSAAVIDFRDYGPTWMAFNSFTDARMEARIPAPKLLKVKTLSLDSFCATLTRRVAIIKVDAESAEAEILAGARRLLEKDRPVLSVEVGDVAEKRSSRILVDTLRSANFTAWKYAAGQFTRHEPKSSYTAGNLIFADSAKDLSEY